MPFSDKLIKEIDDYVVSHLPDDSWYENYFNFIDDKVLAERLEKEFKTVRYIYKILEGLKSTDELQLAQIRIQIILYASIYEAMVHYLLFEKLKDRKEVNELFDITIPVEISIPAHKKEKILSALEHDGKEILTYEKKKKKTDISKIRFDKKAECLYSLGFIDEELKEELILFYEYRNAIHIHAEIKKDIQYELEISKKAYWRFQKFKQLVENKLKS
ncbi:MAG: hypothetical protein PHN38_08370 [Sulfurospirillaceae bacterium]|nr:hypothetical protein [Sulfurospirillaceae bacterium]